MFHKKNIINWLLSFGLLCIPGISAACMPHTPSLIITWTYEWSKTDTLPYRFYDDERSVEFIEISNTGKPFAGSYTKLWKKYFIETEFDASQYQEGDSIIMLADYINGSDIILETYFSVFEIAKLECINDILTLIHPQWMTKDWGKNLWQCWNYTPNWVMDEKELLQKLQETYNLCNSSSKSLQVDVIKDIKSETQTKQFKKYWDLLQTKQIQYILWFITLIIIAITIFLNRKK